MDNIYFIADPHFYHNNIIHYCDRPFSSIEEMNDTLIKNWNSVVDEDDYVYLLGDFGLGTKNELISIGNKLNGHKTLILGNHDHMSKAAYKECGFDKVEKGPIRLHFEGEKMTYWLSHYPIQNIEDNERNIFGHIHNHHDEVVRPPKTYCVSVERIDYTPIKFEDLIGEFIVEP